MDCLLELNAHGLWQCTRCGWVYKFKSDEPPRRNCPKGPDREQYLREKLQREIDELIELDAARRTREEIEANLQICYGGCPELIDGICRRRGRDCTRWRRWVECLVLYGCEGPQ